MGVIRTRKYRLTPSKSQITRFNETLDLCRELYNAALQERRDAWRIERKRIKYPEQGRQLPDIKICRPDLDSVYSQVLTDVLRRLDRNFVTFFRRVKAKEKAGLPRFRSRSRYDSFTYPQHGFLLGKNTLWLSKIGDIRIKMHRSLGGKVRSLTIVRTPRGKWFACFSVEVEPNTLPTSHGAVGVDVGLAVFATLSTGEQIANPRFFRSDENALARAQRQKNRAAAQRVHERIANRRRNLAHQLSHALILRFGAVIFEHLNIRNMARNRKFSKSIYDAAWNQLVRFTTYKAESAGRTVRLVNPRNTSKRCSSCGQIVDKDLSERTHRCPCGLVLDRDHNAAINILTLGLQSLGLRTSEAALRAE